MYGEEVSFKVQVGTEGTDLSKGATGLRPALQGENTVDTKALKCDEDQDAGPVRVLPEQWRRSVESGIVTNEVVGSGLGWECQNFGSGGLGSVDPLSQDLVTSEIQLKWKYCPGLIV